MPTRLSLVLILTLTALFGGCASRDFEGIQSARLAMVAAIPTEPPGNYFIGRRFYKNDYKFWGFVRSPGQPWSSAKLVMLNEQHRLAPDRERNEVGSDNGYEYKLYGEFSGQTVYEPSSNGFYPEFVLRASELRSTSPAPIFNTPGATDPARRVIPKPY